MNDTAPQVIVIAGPNGAGKTTLAPFLLRDDGYVFHLTFLWLQSPDLAVQRVRERVRLEGHDVSDQVVRRRYFAGLRNFWKFYQPLADRWAVYDNSRWEASSLIAAGDREVLLLVHDKRSWISFSGTKP